jgi:hypothetical protein
VLERRHFPTTAIQPLHRFADPAAKAGKLFVCKEKQDVRTNAGVEFGFLQHEQRYFIRPI